MHNKPEGPSRASPTPGSSRYRIVRRLAKGGMGQLELALAQLDTGLEKLVVIKTISTESSEKPEARKMFLEEARLTLALQHANIGSVFDVGVGDDGAPFLVMEHVHGKDLRAVLSAERGTGQPPNLDAAIAIAMGVSAGLHYAHVFIDARGKRRSIIHRDVSPSNVIVSYDGAVKLIDFGIAKEVTANSEVSLGIPRGKVAYMSPEQCLCQPLDRRSDVFSFGTLLYEMTTGKRPFDGPSDFEVSKQIVEIPHPSPGELRADYPPELARIVNRALSKKRDDRYETAEALGRDLEDFARKERRGTSSFVLAARMKELFPIESRDSPLEDLTEESRDAATSPRSRTGPTTPGSSGDRPEARARSLARESSRGRGRTTEPPEGAPCAPTSFFRSDAERAYCFEQRTMMRGRYLLMVQTIIGMLGGDSVRSKAASTLPYRPLPDELYMTADCMRLVEAAADGGVAPARVGAMLMPKCKQVIPTAFPPGRATLRAMLETMTHVNRSETDYEPFRVELLTSERLQFRRSANPYACEFTVGFIEGILRAFGHKGAVHEVECHWLGAEECVFEATLTKPIER
jgi:serine/threonine protein kinase